MPPDEVPYDTPCFERGMTYPEKEAVLRRVEASAAYAEPDAMDGRRAMRVTPAIYLEEELPPLPPTAIEDIIYQGGKLLVAGASKSGMSYLLIELAVAVANGGRWLGFECAQGRVLYVNLEIREPQFMHRIKRVIEARGADGPTVRENMHVSNRRGMADDIDILVDRILASFPKGTYDLIIIDPAYKVQPGPENDADAIAAFCATLDRLAEGHGCTVAYTHHHSKGAQGGKSAADRASGSGVFARDADALIDMTELEWDENVQESRELMGWHGAVPFRLEFVLRDFKRPKPRDIWFRYPIHETDLSGMLEDSRPRGAGRRRESKEEYNARMVAKYEARCLEVMGSRREVARKELQDATGVDRRTLTKYLEQSPLFEIETGHASSTVRLVGDTG